MSIKRTVPNFESTRFEASREFYVVCLGFEVVMERDEIITFAAPDDPSAQISVLSPDGSGAPHPDVSVEVTDVDAMHARAVTKGVEIVYPLTDEPWGVRRFFAVDPNGKIVNVLSHL